MECMKRPETPIITLSEWLTQPAGCYMQAWEQECLDLLTADIFGFNALQVGLPQLPLLAASRMPHIWTSDWQAGAEGVVLTHDFTELPFASHSLDLVVLPHVLEFSSEPHQVLREVERVLIPEGQVIICGFNPASLWGARQALSRVYGNPYLPVPVGMISLPRLKDWLKLLGLGVERHQFGCYAWPFATYRWLNRCQFLERSGARWWPYLGAVYVVQAIKRQKGMTLIGPAWRTKRRALAQGITATNKSKNGEQ
jgi:SAM-dependent methyltransferase